MFHPLWYWEPELVPILILFPLRIRILAHTPICQCHPFLITRKVGAPIAGRFSDAMIKKWRKKRAGKWVAEDRLRTALFGVIWLISPSMALFGVANTYIDGTRGLVVCLFLLFINGIGVSFRRFYDWEGGHLPTFGVGGFSSDRRNPEIPLHTNTSLSIQVLMVLTSIVAYNVDAVRAHSAEVVSAHS